MKSLSDAASAIRTGEELDTVALARFLAEAGLIDNSTITVEQFQHGHSNLTYLVRSREGEFVLRRPPFGVKVKSAHDMLREYKVLSQLSPAYPPAPKPLSYSADDVILGAPFYLMERKNGAVLRGSPPDGFDCGPELVRASCESFVRNLVELHSLDYRSIGLQELYRGEGYVERQVKGWSQRYSGSQTDEIPDVETIVGWLADRVPADIDASLIHNDYKFDNVMIDPTDLTRIVGVLDWEMSTIGDPLADLGTSLAYWIEAGDGDDSVVQCFLTMAPGAMTRIEIARTYGELTGRDVSGILFYYVLALLKLAVILQQIYYRYKQGLTHDERFAGMISMVRQIAFRAVMAIDSGHI